MYLLWRDIEVPDPQIYLLVNVDTRNDEKHPRAPRTTGEKTPKSEDDCSLILLQICHKICCLVLLTDLNNLDNTEKREGKSSDDEEDGKQGEQVSTDARTFLTG